MIDPDIPAVQADTRHLKHLDQTILDRRATSHFTGEPVAEDDLNAILRLATHAPSGYNFQPWRFIVVREAENRQRLQKAALGQEKVGEAPVVIIAVGMREEFKRTAEAILREGAERGLGNPENAVRIRDQALQFIAKTFTPEAWLNRHVMIAFTYLMLLAESFGYDTAPMEGFDPEAVKREFGIPEEGEVIALLAIGRAKEPDKSFPGRLPVNRVFFAERFGSGWPTGD